MSANKEQIMANLIAIRTTVENLMMIIGEPEPAGPLTPEECSAAGHPDKQKLMGAGNFFCPICNVTETGEPE
jgi:hypothetical protein